MGNVIAEEKPLVYAFLLLTAIGSYLLSYHVDEAGNIIALSAMDVVLDVLMTAIANAYIIISIRIIRCKKKIVSKSPYLETVLGVWGYIWRCTAVLWTLSFPVLIILFIPGDPFVINIVFGAILILFVPSMVLILFCNNRVNKLKMAIAYLLRSFLLYIMLFNAIAVIVAIAIGVHHGIPLLHFGEHRFITWISVLQLLTISWLSYKTLLYRRRAREHFLWRASFMVWAIISLGFLFLAMDELFEIHELIDRKIHAIFSIEATGVTDRIDDVLIAIYGLVGINILYVYREELKIFRQALPLLKYGFVLLFIMVALDLITNRKDILSTLVHHDLLDTVYIWTKVAEDSFKVFAISYFLVGFCAVLQIARRMDMKPVAPADS